MNQNLLVSIIVVTRNRPEGLKTCLGLLKAQSYEPFEIIIVDSSSNDFTKEIVSSFEAVLYIRFYNGRNMAVSRNMGLMASKGEIIVFVDDDSYVTEGWMNEIVKGFLNSQVGEVGGRVIEKNANLFTKDAGDVGRFDEKGFSYGRFDYEGNALMEVDWAMGCNMAFRRDTLIKIGGFDPVFKVMNDQEIALRVKKNGYRILFNPKAVVHHAKLPRDTVSRRDEKVNLGSFFLYKRNQFYMFLKNRGFKGSYFKTFMIWDLFYHWKSPYLQSFQIFVVNLLAKIVAMLFYLRSFFSRMKDYLMHTNQF